MAVKAAVDTSALIAALSAWHDRHLATLEVLEGLLAERVELVLSQHVLLETYAVLTRLPPPHRLTPVDAAAVIEQNLRLFTEARPVESVRSLLRTWADANIGGGRIYDLFILASARAAGASQFVTLNPRDVAGFEGEIRVIVP